jgi:hypothetical protein
MTCTDFPHPAPTAARPDDSILFAALVWCTDAAIARTDDVG